MRLPALPLVPLIVVGLLGAGPVTAASAQESTASVSGRVTDRGNGAVLPDTCVSVVDSGEEVVEQVRAGSAGTWSITGLPAGSYLVVFEDCSSPWTHITQAWEDVALDSEREPTPVELGAGESRTGIDARLELGVQARGNVIAHHTLREVHDVCVGRYRVGDRTEPVDVAVSGVAPGGETRDGYVFGGVRPGRYDLVVNPDVCGDDGYAPAERNNADLSGPSGAGPSLILSARPSTQVACGELDAAQPPLFPDVPGGVHRLGVECLSDLEVVKGRADGRFDPAAPVRRDQMAAFVARALEALDVALPAAPAKRFTDVAGNTHERAILQLAELGVVSGRPDGRYAPQETVTRGQTATLLVNAYQRATGFELRERGTAFRDEAGVHQSSIRKATLAGLAAGVGDGTFQPQLPVRRDQMATFVARALDRVLRDAYRHDAA